MADAHGELETDLLIKNLPKELTDRDKEDLLQYFGAKHVVCMKARGKMRNAAYATFSNHATAKQALDRLHQLDVLGQKLVVEFAKSQHKVLASKEKARLSPRPSDTNDAASEDLEKSSKPVLKKSEGFSEHLRSEKVSTKFGLNYTRNSSLHYVYPPPNVSIVTNIANALICVPKFYVQVLHLMNKLNLPAPFGLMTVTPPFPDARTAQEPVSSSEESEIESDTEMKNTSSNQNRKRPASGTKLKVKRLRVQPSQLLQQPTPKLAPLSRQQPVQSVFEQAVGIPQHSTKIGVKLADSISAIFEAGPQQMVPLTEEKQDAEMGDMKSSGFGTFAPTTQEGQKEDVEEEEEEEEVEDGEFITLNEIRRNKISREESKTLSAFKNYVCGEPTSRLYIKNLSKQVEIKDLRRIFGRFIDQNSEHDKQSFDVRLMKEGRMKGQAFVSFPDERSAEKALKETHRYLLLGKPLVVQFARSAKPKD